MGSKAIGIYFRIALVLFIICGVTMFFVEAGSAEFYVTIFSMIISGVLAIVCGILLRCGRKKK